MASGLHVRLRLGEGWRRFLSGPGSNRERTQLGKRWGPETSDKGVQGLPCPDSSHLPFRSCQWPEW